MKLYLIIILKKKESSYKRLDRGVGWVARMFKLKASLTKTRIKKVTSYRKTKENTPFSVL